MTRTVAVFALAMSLMAQSMVVVTAFERSLGDQREDCYAIEKSLVDMRVPIGPELVVGLLEFIAPEFLSPIPIGTEQYACMANCTCCDDGSYWNWRSDYYGDHCRPQFEHCMTAWRARSGGACDPHSGQVFCM